jgi:catechol 2,3-dioxygenase-like lactoylglutathione lyase family enzyme
MLAFDHLSIPSSDPEAGARWLGGILGVAVERDGQADEFACLRLDARVQLLFTHDPSPVPLHFALRASPDVLAAIITRLVHVPHGNDPDHPDNGETSDPLGGAGRVYFRGPDGHLFEICA